eukprot:6771290-Prorocentrum_lima.AAC.1
MLVVPGSAAAMELLHPSAANTLATRRMDFLVWRNESELLVLGWVVGRMDLLENEFWSATNRGMQGGGH